MFDPGALVLVATPIGNLGDLSPRAVEALRAADIVAAEDTRRTRALLTHAGIPGGHKLWAIHRDNERARAADVVEAVRGGARVAYVTDAGMPAISDPGEILVRACLDAGLPVEVVPGPSATLTALALSGLPTGRFAFEGFLPRKGAARAERLAEVAVEDRTTVVFEAPARLGATLADLAAACGPDRPAAVARELTKAFEEVLRGTLAELATRVAATTSRGEYVIVIGPAPTPEGATDDEVAAEAARAVAEEPRAGAAARLLARRLGIPHRRAYTAVLAARDRRRP